MIALGIDTGLAHLGWALVRLNSGEPGVTLIGAGLIRTKKSSKKQNVRASSDRLRRCREQARALRSISAGNVTVNDVAIICIESQSWPRSSSSCAMIGMSFGIVASLAERLSIPILEATPQHIKQHTTGSGSASKAQVAEAISATPGFTNLNTHLGSIPASMREHPVDACGAVLACRDADIVIALLRQEALK